MKNPLEKYKYKFREKKLKHTPITEIAQCEERLGLKFSEELIDFFELFAGSFLAYKYLDAILYSEDHPNGQKTSVSIDPFDSLEWLRYPDYPGCPSKFFEGYAAEDHLPFSEWPAEKQAFLEPYYAGWQPEKITNYLTIGSTYGFQCYLLIGVAESNKNQIFHWDAVPQESYMPCLIASSITDMLERLYEDI